MDSDEVPARRIPVLIPGIFGSSLSYRGKILWSADVWTSFKTLAYHPNILRWERREPADAEFIEAFHLLGLPYRIWSRAIHCLRHSGSMAPDNEWIRFGYEWRASTLHAATILARTLSNRVGEDVSRTATQSPPFVFVTHSMGALVLRATIGLQLLDPSWIERIVYIGAPLLGAPMALSAAYDPEEWPFLRMLFSKIRFPGMPPRSTLINVMQAAARGFDSAYELFPFEEIAYANFRFGEPLFNPLYESLKLVTDLQLQAAQKAHKVFAQADSIIMDAKIAAFSIYSDTCPTTTQLQLKPSGLPPSCIVDDCYTAPIGDGAIPVRCAELSSDKPRRAVGALHEYLCNDTRVMKYLKEVL
jgi:hypothetical protein